MELEELKQMFLSKQSATEDFPFGENYMVFKVMNKMFGLISLKDTPFNINLKCDPQDAIAYREIYESVNPGYHMNKKHWNTITIDESMEKAILQEMIDDSYNLVMKKLTKKQKEELNFKNL